MWCANWGLISAFPWSLLYVGLNLLAPCSVANAINYGLCVLLGVCLFVRLRRFGAEFERIFSLALLFMCAPL